MKVTMRRWTKFILFIFLVEAVFGKNECEIDVDCPEGKFCKIVCNVDCETKCTTLEEKESRELFSKEQTSSSEEPFVAETNPFEEFSQRIQRDDAGTPLTISESELEEELRESFQTTVPPNSEISAESTAPEAHESTSSSSLESFTEPNALETHGNTEPQEHHETTEHQEPQGHQESGSSVEPISPDGYGATASSGSAVSSSVPEESTVYPPSETPQPPGFSDLDHPSGYFTEKKLEDVKTTVESELTVSMTTEAVVSSSNSVPVRGYDTNALGISENDLSLQDLHTTSESVESTFAPEIGPNNKSDVTLPEQGVPAEPLPENTCPPPEVCGKNCGVYIDANGCQTCQCLWLPIPCESSSDCVEEGQFCDLGRCECMPGYLQDMRQSGICMRDESVSDEELQKIEAEVHQSEATTRSYPIRRKRAQASEKPTRMERLQWPGPHQLS
ncbi:hypothetical protein FO519_008298 [Halicephalobus sp. NKZ332]|nr:hypothetical protein FO519_008298 [Halicephalobus sp. NKZ332]